MPGQERDGLDLLRDGNCRFTQIQWYRHLPLTEPHSLLMG